ncbi:aldehyde dehydrogenase family protein [Pendulispora albinea]|uniref:Aldehyde dehydrogenase family protein n=1 Tax=Pendulispora albinea TaxID=2741071 RepID=A0ABZ2LZA2_9BACT
MANEHTKLALHWIDGQWVDSGLHRDSIDPATYQVIGRYADAGVTPLVQRGIAARLREQLAQRVNRVVEDAIGAGAQVIVRGGPITDGPLAKGAFYRPTLLEVTDPKLPIVQQETFGPVLTLQIFDTEAEAVALANDSIAALLDLVVHDAPVVDPHGARLHLARDPQRTIHVTRPNAGRQPVDEQSGLGRLNGVAAMDDFIEYKHITLTSGVIPS